MVKTIHYCHFCDYKTDRKYDRDKHMEKKHQSQTVQNHTGSGVVQNAHQTVGQSMYQS